MIDQSYPQATRRQRSLLSSFGAALWACWLATAFASAQTPPPSDAPTAQPAPQPPEAEPEKQQAPPKPEAGKSDDLPKAEVILDQYIEATGGKAAYEKIRNQVLTARIAFTGEVEGSLKLYLALPNLMYSYVEIENRGTSEQGFDGKTAWQKSSTGGARIKDGAEKAMTTRDATLFPELNWRKIFAKVETVSKQTVDDRDAYEVVFTAEDGTTETRFFDAESRLLRKIVRITNNQAPVEIYVIDYQRVDGILVPRTKQHWVAGQKQTIVFDKIEHNVDLPKDRFHLPKDVAALLRKDSAPPGETPAAEPPKKP